MIYMWALPYAYPKYRETVFDGLIAYPDRMRHIPAALVSDEFKNTLIELIARIGSSTEAHKVPSYSECKYCEIGKEDCADRIEEEETEGSITTTLF
jgi:hypothetical protein